MTSKTPLALERELEDDCDNLALRWGWIPKKLDKNDRSWPDKMYLGPGASIFFVEFKRRGETARRQQVERLLALRKLSFPVYLIDQYCDFEVVFHAHLGCGPVDLDSAKRFLIERITR